MHWKGGYPPAPSRVRCEQRSLVDLIECGIGSGLCRVLQTGGGGGGDAWLIR